jgi:heterodisulfide reductase subunit A-like polyferredoxin
MPTNDYRNGVVATSDLQGPPLSNYHYVKQYVGKAKKAKIIIIGAGITGIGAVKIFKDLFKDEPVELTIYEKNEDVGGTWLENRYPGLAIHFPNMIPF